MSAGRARVAGVYLRVSLMNDLQYRANFFIQLLQSAIAIGTGLAVLGLVFGRTDELHGWDGSELLVVLGVFTLMGGLIRTFVQPAMQRLLEEIQRGTFDYALVKPADAQLLISVRNTQIWQGVDILLGIAVIVAGVVRSGTGHGVADVLAFTGMLGAGMVMIYCFWLILTTGAFWLVRMDEVQELFTGIYRAGQYPVGVYPGWLRYGLTFIVPLAFAITTPAEAVTNRLTLAHAGLAIAVAVLFVVVSRVFWRVGLRRYSGASA